MTEDSNEVQNEEVVEDEEVSTEEVDTSTEDTSEDTIEDSNSDQSEEDNNSDSSEDDGDSLTSEELDAMDDDQFTEYMNTGKRPTVNKARVVSPGNTTSASKPKTVEKTEEKKPVVQNTQTPTDIDYKAVVGSIFRPFKANGKEITPRSVEDVISLMQMGANYTKKMQVMAPMKKAVESLNKANIDKEELNFLIDLHNGDKEAIKKLLQKHSVDPMDLDLESTNYVPHNNIASDEDVSFRDVIEDIGEDNLPKVENIVNKKWDSESRKILLKDPNLLRKLGEEVQLGRFDAVQTVLDEERAFGRYKGVSDLEAYSDIVTKYVNYQNQQLMQQQRQQQSRSVQSRPTKNVSDKSKAAPNRSKPSKQTAKFTASDLFNMSEEDFEKLSINDLV